MPTAGCEKSCDCDRTPCSHSVGVVDLQWISDISWRIYSFDAPNGRCKCQFPRSSQGNTGLPWFYQYTSMLRYKRCDIRLIINFLSSLIIKSQSIATKIVDLTVFLLTQPASYVCRMWPSALEVWKQSKYVKMQLLGWEGWTSPNRSQKGLCTSLSCARFYMFIAKQGGWIGWIGWIGLNGTKIIQNHPKIW